MVSITVKRVLKENFKGCPNNIRIYILEAYGHPLYIGKTTRYISFRLTQHMERGTIRKLMRANRPSSLGWKFKLYTHDEAAQLASLPDDAPLNTVEDGLIKKARPSLNRAGNKHPRRLPDWIKTDGIDLSTPILEQLTLDIPGFWLYDNEED